MGGIISFQNSSVNSGTTVELPSAEVTYAWSNLTNTTPVPGKFDIVETDVGGFENPKINIRGVMDAGELGTNKLTPSLLKSFAKLEFDGTTSTCIKLVVGMGADGVTPLYLKNSGDSTDFIYCIIESFNLIISSMYTNERKIEYNIILVETEVS